MTSPRVIELPRRLEPVSRDTFLAGVVLEFPAAAPDNVVALPVRDALAQRRRPAPVPPPAAA